LFAQKAAMFTRIISPEGVLPYKLQRTGSWSCLIAHIMELNHFPLSGESQLNGRMI